MLQQRAEHERHQHPQQGHRHVQRQVVAAFVVTVCGNGGGTARPARHLVDREARALGGELGVADIGDLAVLGVRGGGDGDEDVDDLHLDGEAVADLGLEVDVAAVAGEGHVEDLVVEQLALGDAPEGVSVCFECALGV